MGDEERPNVNLLHKATISIDYLHTNSTTHEFVFGAIAELVDNSRDADANSLHIDLETMKLSRTQTMRCISVLDDGCGMSPQEAIKVVTFGHSNKKATENMIGQYGNGLKSGAMRIAKNFILFTKREGVMSCLLLSRSFHDKFKLNEIFVPCPAFDALTKEPFCDDITTHEEEMKTILHYSPFHTPAEIFKQFDRINGEHGTLIILFDLRCIETGDYELNFSEDTDIRLTNYEEHREEERNSLRAYLSVLYLYPRMKIYLRQKKVRTHRLLDGLVHATKYSFKPKNIKACAKTEVDLCAREEDRAKEQLKVAQSNVGSLTGRVKAGENLFVDKSLRAKERMLQKELSDCIERVAKCAERKKKAEQALRNPNPLTFYFGLNVNHRNRYGCMIYNNGRLIEMYVKLNVQKEHQNLMMKCLGVMGLVDVPYSVLAPTHNKQAFENKREYMSLLKSMNEHMEQYWNDIPPSENAQTIKTFWKDFGYDRTEWNAEPNYDEESKKKRLMKVGFHIQCDACLKWRHLPCQTSMLKWGVPDNWQCSDNRDSAKNSCQKSEEPEKIKLGTLSRNPVKVTAKDALAQKKSFFKSIKQEAGEEIMASPPRPARPLQKRPSPVASSSRPSTTKRNKVESPRKSNGRRVVVSDDSDDSDNDAPRNRTQTARKVGLPPSSSRMGGSGAPPSSGKRNIRVSTTAEKKRRVDSDDEFDNDVFMGVPQNKTKSESQRSKNSSVDTICLSESSHASSKVAPTTNGTSARTPANDIAPRAVPATNGIPKKDICSTIVGRFAKNRVKCVEKYRGMSSSDLEKLDWDAMMQEAFTEISASCATGLVRKMIHSFVKMGLKAAIKHKDDVDHQLLNFDTDQFARNVFNEWQAPNLRREIPAANQNPVANGNADDEGFREIFDDLKSSFNNGNHLGRSLESILTWAWSAFNEIPVNEGDSVGHQLQVLGENVGFTDNDPEESMENAQSGEEGDP